MSLSDNLAVGDYVVRYFENDTTKQLAEAAFRVKDSTAPVIKLLGEASVTIDSGVDYTDAGATAHDKIDGDLTAFIEVKNPVDTSKPGTYTVTYDVVDKSGNDAAEVIRTVQVVNAQPPTLTIQAKANGTVTISFGGRLQTADSVNGPWQEIAGGGQVTLPSNQAKRFFRAVR